MRIWTRKSALIQPRTSLGRVMCRGCAAGHRPFPRGLPKIHSAERVDVPLVRSAAAGDAHSLLLLRDGDLVLINTGRFHEVEPFGTAAGTRPGCAATTHHSFRGSFSAGSTPIFASKYAFFRIFRDLQENHLLASKFCKFLQNFGIFDTPRFVNEWRSERNTMSLAVGVVTKTRRRKMSEKTRKSKKFR